MNTIVYYEGLKSRRRYSAIVKGALEVGVCPGYHEKRVKADKEYLDKINNSLIDGQYFVPAMVGLPMSTDDVGSQYRFMGMKDTDAFPTMPKTLTIRKLANKFAEAADRGWL